MDFGAITAKKFSNGYGVSGKSAYDGVFASPIKFRAPTLSSSFGDYCEIFGGSEASLGSSIPVLEVPELNERKILHDIRRSKLDYSKVFGGFGNLDTAVPYEELFSENKKKDSFSKGALSPDKGGNHSSTEDSANSSKEIPLVSQEASFNGANKVNMSYHKVNQGSESRRNGKTHIAQLHAVPAFTCLVEEVNPSKINSADKFTPVVQHAYPGSDCKEKIKKSGHYTKSVTDPSPDSANQQFSNGVKFPDRSDLVHMFLNAREVSHGSDSGTKQSSNGGVEVQDRSDSINMFSDACEVSHESEGADYIEVPTSQTVVGDLDNHHGHAVRSMANKCHVSKSDASEVAAGADSPLHFYDNDMIDSNSEAAASVAVLRKAIEEAQERLKIAKDLMKRKKEGFPDRVKRRFNNDLKAERKKDKFSDKTMRHEETNLQPFGKMDVFPQMPSVIGKPMMREEQVTLDLRAEEMVDCKEAARKALKKLESTIGEHEEEVEHKEVDHKETVIEVKDADNNKEILYTVEDYHLNEKNTGKNTFEKPEEYHQIIEVVEGPCKELANEGKVNSGNEAGGCEELVDEKKFSCEEHVEDTKLAQETLDYGEKDKNLKKEDDEVIDNKVAPFVEQEDSERKLGEHELPTGNEKKLNCKPDDEKQVEGPCEQEDCTSLRDHQGLTELKKKVTEEQLESEEKVDEVFAHLKECELREIMEPVDNEKPSNLHDTNLISTERHMKSLGCVDDGKKKNEAGFLDLNLEIEYFCQREGTENGFGNIYVQEILEDNAGCVDEEELLHEIMTKDSDSDGNERVQCAKEDEMELEGATYMMEENEKHNSESIEVIGVILDGPNYEEEKTKEVERTTEINPNNEVDEGGNFSKIQVADESIESNKIPEVTSEGFSHNEQDHRMEASNASFQCEEKYNEPESVQEMNEFGEKHTLETSALAQGALELNEAINQMQYTNETVYFDSTATNIGEPDEKVEQNQDDCLKEVENDCNLAMHVEEPSPDFVDLCKDTKEAEDALNAEIDENRCNLSDEEILADNEHNIEASQPPSMSEWESSTFNYQEIKRTHSNLNEAEDDLNAEIDEDPCKSSYEEIIVDNEPNLEASQPASMSEWKSSTFSNQEIKRTPSNTKENHQATLAREEKKANDTSQKVELETDHLKKIDEIKERGREREKEKEKIAVERAIREARERAFAEARERAALERASAEARRKNISDGREKLGRTTGQANEKTLTERAAMEAKLKAERAAVERATAEARARALERALSEKAASEARNKYDKFFAEKPFGASKDNGTRPNLYSKSFSYGDTFDGANGDSAQRCKARFERHQRIGERVAKALAEKNARDRLVQKEQEERNRVAEALDADVKRWSSGKEGNLRALLSTLQYILGPDSGWQPIHLTDIVNAAAVKKAYRKATLFVHPDKLQQRGASIQQKYTCEKVFDLLKEAWNRFNMEER